MKLKSSLGRIASIALVLALVLCFSASTFAASPISSDSAMSIAYTDAGVSADDVIAIDKLVQFRSNNAYFYKFVFRTTSAKYVYTIGTDGTIVNAVVANFNTSGGNTGGSVGSTPGGSAANTVTLTQEDALSIALTQFGLTRAQLKEYEIDLECKRSVYYYEVELETTSGSEYDCDINAETGAVFDSSASLSAGDSSGCTVSITAEEALSIATTHAGVSASALKKHEVELETKNNAYYYEVEFKTTGGTEYEYRIDATTGAVLHHEVD